MVPDAPLQIRHRGSVVACPDLVSGHCCMVEGMTKEYSNYLIMSVPTRTTTAPTRTPVGLRWQGHTLPGLRIIGQKYGWEGR